MSSEYMDIEHQQSFYNKYWKDYSALSAYKIQRTTCIMNLLLSIRKDINPNPVGLDLGCGDGRLSPLWREVMGGEMYALDLSPEAMDKAKHRYPFVHYTAGDATNSPYESGMFDVVINQEVIEHIEDQEKIAREFSRLLKKNGYLVLTTPNKYYFDHRKGGNYSQQPIEKILTKEGLTALLAPYFNIKTLTTIIFTKGDLGIYKLYTNRYLLGALNKLGLKNSWVNYLLKKGYGLHLVVVAQKKN